MKAISNPDNSDNDNARPLSIERYMAILKIRKSKVKEKKWQPTQHQQDAADTAEMLDDVKSIGIYLNLFKKYKRQRHELLRCRDWVMRKGKIGKGRLFVSVYKKFLGLGSARESANKKTTKIKK